MSAKIYIGNLSWGTDENTLRAAFSEFGPVLDAVVMKEAQTGRSRGFGFVTYGSQQEADQAISTMNEQTLDGRKLRVNVATSTRVNVNQLPGGNPNPGMGASGGAYNYGAGAGAGGNMHYPPAGFVPSQQPTGYPAAYGQGYPYQQPGAYPPQPQPPYQAGYGQTDQYSTPEGYGGGQFSNQSYPY